MKQMQISLFLAALIFAVIALGKDRTSNGRAVDLKSYDSTVLKGTYFPAAKPGPAVLLYHQSNRTRKEWDMVARQLAAAGINTLTVDVRGHGETGGQESHGEARKKQWPLDLDAAFQYLPGILVDWFVTTLIKTPGHAPADTVASAAILNQLETPDGVAQATRRLTEARQKDPKAQLWPEVTVDIIASGHLRDGDAKTAIEIFKLNLLAYSDSADAHSNLANAYLKDGQKDLARQYAEKAVVLLDSHAAAASSWSDTEQRRAEIRKDIQRTLQEVSK